jgi:hypothetical protein
VSPSATGVASDGAARLPAHLRSWMRPAAESHTMQVSSELGMMQAWKDSAVCAGVILLRFRRGASPPAEGQQDGEGAALSRGALYRDLAPV